MAADRGGAASPGGEPASGPACLPGEQHKHPKDSSCEGKSRPESRLAGRTAGPTLSRKCAVILALALSPLWAQARVSVDQIVFFVRSSIHLKHPDKQVATYLLKLKLSERLDAR